jgi:hypothetical protein
MQVILKCKGEKANAGVPSHVTIPSTTVTEYLALVQGLETGA